MKKVLFVCMGNICRSPMAEGLFVQKLNAAGLQGEFSADSAGCGGWHEGEQPDRRTQHVATKYGFSLPSLARQIRPRDVLENEYIIVMDRDNYSHVSKIMHSRNSKAKLHYLREFDPESDGQQPVPDPYNGTMEDFEAVYRMLDRSLDVFLASLGQEGTPS